MKITDTVKEYLAALERLKKNASIRVPKGSPINKDQVALEAGRKRGSIRNRRGFEGLIAEIESASKHSHLAESTHSQTNASQSTQVEQLKRDLDIARSRYMSLLYLNAEMAKVIRKLGGEVPQYGVVTEIQVDPNSTDIPY